MTSGTVQRLRTEQVVRQNLPLAVYREVAAHLRQVRGIEIELETQRSPQFDYCQSQIGALLIHYSEHFREDDRLKIDKILSFYGDRHGAWQREEIAPKHQ